MRSLALLLARLLARVVAVIGGFWLCFVVLASIVAPPVSVQPPTVMAIDNSPVWTEHPTQIDRATRPQVAPMQDLFPYRFRGAGNIQVHDGSSFSVPDGIMLLEDIVAPQPRAICIDSKGRRNACGARARAELRSLMVGKYVECRRSLLVAGVWLANCHINGRSLSQTMLDRADITAVHRVMAPAMNTPGTR